MNEFYEKLNLGQIENIYKNRKKQTGKYLAMWCESGHLDKYMITLSPAVNTVEFTIELRKEFFKLLNKIKKKKKAKLAYFSAIEAKVNEIPVNEETKKFEEERMSNDDINWHLHIQFLTTLSKKDIQELLKELDSSLCSYKHLTFPKKGEDNRKYEYVIKDLKDIDFKAQYYIKKYAYKKTLYTSSRKQLADYIIKKLYHYMEFMYPDIWKNIKNKYGLLFDLKDSDDIIFGNIANNTIIPDDYDRITVKDKTIDIKKIF